MSERLQTAHFFSEVEQMIVDRLHDEAESPEGRAELVRSTGINDETLIDELIQLGVTADGVVALRLFPLVLVAWSGDATDADERNTVMAEALRLGIREDSTAWVLLNTWLKHRPPSITVDAWKRYTKDMFASMSTTSRRRMIEFMEKEMTAVAKASGGHFGLGKISKQEAATIKRMKLIMEGVETSLRSSGSSKHR